MDPVLSVLLNPSFTRQDLLHLCRDYPPTIYREIFAAYDILTALIKYLDESQSWSFRLLESYDFQSKARQFDLDVAVVVGARSEFVLDEIATWNIRHLKTIIAKFPSYSSDPASVLTTLVLRILSKYSELELALQMSVSRSKLVKIHFELGQVFDKLDPETGDISPEAVSRNTSPSFMFAYQKFVQQLLHEMESTPFESVHQELFQIVDDLRVMFEEFSSSHGKKGAYSTASRPVNEETYLPYEPHDSRGMTDESTATTDSSMSGSDMFGSYASSRTSAAPSLDEWLPSTGSKKAGSHLHSNLHSSSHRRSFSGSTAFSTASTSSSIVEELPSIMHAFEVAKHQEYVLSHNPNNNTSSDSFLAPSSSNTQQTDPMAQSMSSSMMSSMTSSTSSPISPSPSLSFIQQHSVSPGTPGARLHKNKNFISHPMLSQLFQSPSQHTPLTDIPSSSPSSALVNRPLTSPAPSTPTATDQTVEVKMISNRMMVKMGSEYVDMQDWVNKANQSPQQAKNQMFLPKANAPSLPTLKSTASTPVMSKPGLTALKAPATSLNPPSNPTTVPKPIGGWTNGLHTAEKQFEENYKRSMDNF